MNSECKAKTVKQRDTLIVRMASFHFFKRLLGIAVPGLLYILFEGKKVLVFNLLICVMKCLLYICYDIFLEHSEMIKETTLGGGVSLIE